MAKEETKKSLVEATRVVYEALEPFEDQIRGRIIASVLSLFGMGKEITNFSTTPSSNIGSQTNTNRPQHNVSDRPLSPIELIQQKQPKNNAQYLAVFAYFREKYEGFARFSRNDLKPYFAKAKLPPPKNFDRDFREAVKLGFIYEDGSDSYLTSKGLELVETGFGNISSTKKK